MWISLVIVSTYCHLPPLFVPSPYPFSSVEKTVDILVGRDYMLTLTGLDHRISYWCQQLNTSPTDVWPFYQEWWGSRLVNIWTSLHNTKLFVLQAWDQINILWYISTTDWPNVLVYNLLVMDLCLSKMSMRHESQLWPMTLAQLEEEEVCLTQGSVRVYRGIYCFL